MKRSLASLAALLIGVSSLAGAYSGQDSKEGRGPGGADGEARMERKMDKIHQQLGLSPDQQKKLKEHRQAHRQEMRTLRESLRTKRESLRAELEKPDLNEGIVKSLSEELKTLQNRLADLRLDGILEVRKILSPEQFKKFGELMREKGRMKMGRRGGPHDDMPDGN